MGKNFEIVYSPEQYNVQTNADQAIAWGGINTMQPENVIDPRFTPSADDVFLRNAEIRSRPTFVPNAFSAPDTNRILGLIPGFNSSGTGNNLIAATNGAGGGLYRLDNALAWHKLAGSNGIYNTNVPVSWRIFQNVLYITSSVGSSEQWDGVNDGTLITNAITIGVTPVGARFITELDNHLILLNTTEAGVNFPYRMRWSANGLPLTWNPAVNVNAGSNDFLDVSDSITGEAIFGRVGYIYRNNGLTEFAPTGNGILPFDFNHIMASQFGIGNVLPDTIGQYGNNSAFVANDDIYNMTPNSLEVIGGNARDAIFNDLGSQSASDATNGPAAMGVIVPFLQGMQVNSAPSPAVATSYIHLMYLLFMRHNDSNTRMWAYSFKEKNWTRHLLPGFWVTAKPTLSPFNSTFPQVLLPCTHVGVGQTIATFNALNFNDSAQGSSYSFRQEDVEPNRVPTVRRVILMYRDIGTGNITVTVQGINDNGTLVTKSKAVTLGGANDNNIKTAFVDLTMTGFRPQLSWTRAANGGPFSIVKAVMVGESEEITL